jgi:DNA-binding transcriptional ArsR family regulator
MSDIFSVLSDPTRRAILTALATKSQTVGDLVSLTGEGQPTVSKHLKTLRDSGLVTVEAAGQARVYSIVTKPLAEVHSFLAKLGTKSTDGGSASASRGSLSSPTNEELPRLLGEAGEKLGGLLAAGATWLNSQIAAKLTEANVDPNKLGKDLGRKLAEAKGAAADLAGDAEGQLRDEVSELSAKLGAKIAEVKDQVLPAKNKKPAAKTATKSSATKAAPKASTNTKSATAKPAVKKTGAKKPTAKKPAAKN